MLIIIKVIDKYIIILLVSSKAYLQFNFNLLSCNMYSNILYTKKVGIVINKIREGNHPPPQLKIKIRLTATANSRKINVFHFLFKFLISRKYESNEATI